MKGNPLFFFWQFFILFFIFFVIFFFSKRATQRIVLLVTVRNYICSSSIFFTIPSQVPCPLADLASISFTEVKKPIFHREPYHLIPSGCTSNRSVPKRQFSDVASLFTPSYPLLSTRTAICLPLVRGLKSCVDVDI